MGFSCGSGKKYKKCCLDKEKQKLDSNNEINLLEGVINLHKFLLKQKQHIKVYHHLRKVHSEILDSMISYFEKGKYDINRELTKLSEYNSKQLKKDSIDTNLENITFYDLEFSPNSDIEMMFFYGLSIYKNNLMMKSITEIYLENNNFKSLEKVKMLNAMNSAYTSIFEVIKVDMGNGYVYLKDVFTSQEFKIIDEALSFHEKAISTYYFYSRIITIDDISFGNCTMFIDKDNSEINDLISKFKKNNFSIYELSIVFYRIAKKENSLECVKVNNVR